MGKYGTKRKLTVEECIELDIRELVQAGVLKDSPDKPWIMRWNTQKNPRISKFKGKNFGKELIVTYTVVNEPAGEIDHMDYPIEIVRTPCHFGGFRRWFLCPFPKEAKQCGRRVGKLYLPPGGRYWGCRHCYNLAYESQMENRAISKDLLNF